MRPNFFQIKKQNKFIVQRKDKPWKSNQENCLQKWNRSSKGRTHYKNSLFDKFIKDDT